MFESEGDDLDFDEDFELSLVTAEKKAIIHDKPSSSSSDGLFKTPASPVPRKRKFPGPAGIIPGLSNYRVHNTTTTQVSEGDAIIDAYDAIDMESQRESKPVSSQSDETLFGECWLRMTTEYECSEPDPESPINKFNIAWLKRESVPGSSKKTPILIVIVKSLDFSSPDPTCSFLDRSGSINGMIHRDVMENYGHRITVGSVLVLKNVAVLMTIRNHYVNITGNNLMSVYHSQERLDVGVPQSISALVEEYESKVKAAQLDKTVSDLQFSHKKMKKSNQTEKLLEGLDEDSLFGDF